MYNLAFFWLTVSSNRCIIGFTGKEWEEKL
jgi:hypothetical protein